MDPGSTASGDLETSSPDHEVYTDTERSQRSPPPEWPSLKFESIGDNCTNCGTSISSSPYSIGNFCLSLMPPKSNAVWAKENEDLKAQADGKPLFVRSRRRRERLIVATSFEGPC